jgi:hypothetical protein
LRIAANRYVKRVKRAADHLAAGRYITDKDRKALIAAAQQEPFRTGDDDGNDVIWRDPGRISSR